MRIVVLLIALVSYALTAFPVAPPAPVDYRDTTKIDLSALERGLLTEVNRVRAERGLPAYVFSQRLWYHAKNHSRRMALEQKLAAMDLRETLEARAGTHPTSFWAGLSGDVVRVENNAESWAPIVQGWARNKDSAVALVFPRYNRAAVGVSVDRAGALYAALIVGEEVYAESDRQRLEQRVFDIVNQSRAKRGLPPLQYSEALARVARTHSEEMALRFHLSHTDIRGLGVAERLRLNRIDHWQACAENIASNQGFRDSVKAAVDGWLSSPPHAAILSRRDFTHTGIGVAQALDETYYFTQIFTKTP